MEDAKKLISLLKLFGLKEQQGQASAIPEMEDWWYQKLPLPANNLQNDGHNCGAFVCLFVATIMQYRVIALHDQRWLHDTAVRIGAGDKLWPFVFDTIFRSAD